MRVALIRTYQRMTRDQIAHPLGIMALDAWLRRSGRHTAHLFDMRLKKETPEQIVERLLPLNVDVVGLSALTIEKDTIHRLTRFIKASAPATTVVVGGPYATSSRRTLLRDRCIDYVVVGEGEVTFAELLDHLDSGSDVSTVPGLVYRRGEDIHETPPRTPLADLDELPIPSWDRIDMEAYERCEVVERFTRLPWAAFYTSRGCPFRCTYCHDVFGKKFRARSAAKVIEEMELLHDRYGVREFHFYDDIFNFRKERVLEICRRIREKGWKIHLQFPNGVRADMMDTELLAAMKAAGTFRVSYAIESASVRIQKQVRKHLRINRVEKLIEDTDKLGILMHGFFMLGFPGERRDEMQATVDWAVRSKLHTAAFFRVSPFEGTALSKEYLEPALATHGEDFTYYNNPHSLSAVPAEEVGKLQQRAYLRFYLHPRRMARLLMLLPNRRVILHWLPMYLRILLSGWKIQGNNAESFDHSPESVPTNRPVFSTRVPAPPPVPVLTTAPTGEIAASRAVG
jgi:radical SAM superfamily enzyme YgiQ (UPF0313 family)